jgi:hypothetical protein
MTDASNVLSRLEIPEQRMSALELLPARFDALSMQIERLRDETRGGLSALRAEMCDGDEETRRVLRDEIRAGDEQTRALVRTLNDETRTHMLVLHEDLVERVKRLGEAPAAQPSGGARVADRQPGRRGKAPRRGR